MIIVLIKKRFACTVANNLPTLTGSFTPRNPSLKHFVDLPEAESRLGILSAKQYTKYLKALFKPVDTTEGCLIINQGPNSGKITTVSFTPQGGTIVGGAMPCAVLWWRVQRTGGCSE